MVAYLELIVLLSNQNCAFIKAAKIKIGNLLRSRSKFKNKILALFCIKSAFLPVFFVFSDTAWHRG